MPKRTHAAAMQTRQFILQAALKLFSQRGYEKTSLSDIAREAGVTRGAIYWHFEDKLELLCELCKEVAEKHHLVTNLERAADPEESDPLGHLRQWMLAHTSEDARIFFSSSLVQTVRSIVIGGAGSSEIRDRFKELLDFRNQMVMAAIRNAVNHHQLPADLDVELTCCCLVNLMVGYCSGQDEISEQERQRAAQNFGRLLNFTFTQLHLLRRGCV